MDYLMSAVVEVESWFNVMAITFWSNVMKDRLPERHPLKDSPLIKFLSWKVLVPVWFGMLLFVVIAELGGEIEDREKEQQQTPPARVENKS